MNQKPRSPLSAPIPRLRFTVLIGFLVLWAVIIAARLVWLQVVCHAEYAGREMRQQRSAVEIAPRRGVIYDRNLQPLAMTVLVDSIYAVPHEISDKEKLAKELAQIVHTHPDDPYTTARAIDHRLQRSRDFAWVARKVDSKVSDRIRALHLKGIYFQKEFKRFYPDNELAAQVLGYVSMDDNGIAGIERQFDHELHGSSGRILLAVDARRHSFGSVERDPTPGKNLVLTLDQHIQFMTEQALDENMARTKALRGMIVVQDPNTGQILALAVRPTFNPNDTHDIQPSMLRDPAVSDVYEPGSVFKLVTYSAGLDTHVITPDTRLPTLGGVINVAGRLVHDDRDAIRYEAARGNVLTATEALQESSDVAAIEVAQRMGKDEFYRYIRAFGFGQTTGIALPAETRGLLKPPKRWTPTTIGSIPMGQEVGVTPLQLVTMVSTIANGGVYLPPKIVLDTSEANGPKLVPTAFHPEHELPSPLPKGARRVISTLTAAEMRKMAEGVVLYGTGAAAQLNGYSAAGKTGTAQKIDPETHTYSKTKYIASFAGFAPVNDPAISIVITMDSPQYSMHYGASASAPVFHKLAQQILEYLDVPHDQPLKSPREMAAIEKRPATGDEPNQHLDSLTSLFAEINHLPADDPLRNPPTGTQAKANADEAKAYESPGADAPVSDITADDSADSPASTETDTAGSSAAPRSHPASIPTSSGGTTPVSGKPPSVTRPQISVPDFAGQSMREAVTSAANLGLNISVHGNGNATEQAPPAGTRVPLGTTVVIRFQP